MFNGSQQHNLIQECILKNIIYIKMMLLLVNSFNLKKTSYHMHVCYELWIHQVDRVSACLTQMRYRCTLDISITCVRHAVLRVPVKKYYFSTRTRDRHDWHCSDMARIQSSTFFFFQLFDGSKKNSKDKKCKFI